MADAAPSPIRIRIHPAQLGFIRERSVPFVGFVGGRGSGKSYAAALRLYEAVMTEPGPYGMYAPTYPLLRDTVLEAFLQIAKPHIASYNSASNNVTMVSGSVIRCRSLDDYERARGPSLRGAVWDEASLCPEEAFNVLIACLRWQGQQGWLGCTFTPKGPLHWTAKRFGKDAPDSKIFHARTKDNPFNPPEFAEILRRQYTSLYAEQELEGQFISLAGRIFRREWFKIVDEAPPLGVVARYWDMAATPLGGDNADPDWTAGAKVGRCKDGRWIILDLRHARLSPLGNELMVRRTAEEDGRRVHVYMEKEPGASGKALVEHYARVVLGGYVFKEDPPIGDKIVRAQPLAAAAENGNVMLLRGAWNGPFLDEAEQFGEDTEHDDQVDAAGGAFNAIGGRKIISPHAGTAPRPGELSGYEDILAKAKTPQERAELEALIRRIAA